MHFWHVFKALEKNPLGQLHYKSLYVGQLRQDPPAYKQFGQLESQFLHYLSKKSKNVFEIGQLQISLEA